MKRLLFLLMCLVTLAVPSFAAVTTNIVCADEGLKDFTSTSWSWTHDPFTFTVDKQGGGNNPVFNTNFNDLRVYAKGTFTIKAKSAMTKVVFNLSSQGMKRLAPITASNGTIAKQALGDNTVTWTGDADEVTFTVGDKANYGSDGGEKAGQLCFLSFEITTVSTGPQYTSLAYIECTGGRRENAFVTDYVPSTPTTVGVGFQQTGDNEWAAIFCARNTHAGTGISLYANSDKTHLGYFTGGTTGAGDKFVENYDNRARYDVVAHTTYLKWTKAGEEEKTKETGNTEMNETSRCLSIFANPEWDNAFKGRIYYLNIEDGEVNYAYKPVMRHDGVYGYLDATSGKFVTPKEGNYDNYTYGVLEDHPIVSISTLAVELKEGKTATVTVGGATKLTWTSSDTNVATVENGVITGVVEGDCTVTCTTDELGGWEFTIKVSVRGNIDYYKWDGTSEAILPSVRHTGDAGKAAYTKVFNSEMRYIDADKNKIWGTPENDAEGKQWFEADYNVEAWDYTTNVLPNGWCDNDVMGDVYARRYFKANGDLTGKTVYMPAPHDDSPCEYYINGTLVWQRTGTEPGDGWYEDEVVRLTEEQKALIKTDGSLNVFAFHVHQNWGGRYADGGLYIDGQPKNWFEGDDNRRRLEAAIAQLEAEGKTVPEEAKNATNYRQDAGRYLDLVRYAPRLEAGKHDYSAVASAKAADGLECWIYNVGAGMFLAGGNDWGTHMSLNPALSCWPMVLHANTSGANRYSIQSNLPNGLRGSNDGMGHNGYVDCGGWNTTSVDWAWEFEEVGNGNYRIINSQNTDDRKYLGMTDDRRLQVDTDKRGADNVFNQWKLFTRAELDALWASATAENPADVTYMIHQNAFSQNDFEGDDKGQADDKLSDSKWERNAGKIWDWKNNGADGDYVYEMWNASGDVYLKQTVEGLRPGKYIVSCQGYYRDGNYESAIAGNDAQLAYLYAGTQDNKVALPSILEGMNKGYGYGRDTNMDKLIPDGCAEAAHFFQMGCYKAQVEVMVGTDGVLELGVFRGGEGVKEGDWIVVDNFRLTCVNGKEPLNGLAAVSAMELEPWGEEEVLVKLNGEKVTFYGVDQMQGFIEDEETAFIFGINDEPGDIATGKALTGLLDAIVMDNMGEKMLIINSFMGECTDVDVSKGREIVESNELLRPENANRLVTVYNTPMCPIAVDEDGMVMVGDCMVMDGFYQLPDDYEWPANIESITGILYNMMGMQMIMPRSEADIVAGAAAPDYMAVGETKNIDDWEESKVAGIRNIDVEGYNDHVIVRNFMGGAGYDIKVAFDTDDDGYQVVKSLTPIVNGEAGEAVTSGTLKMETGNADYPVVEFTVDADYAEVSSAMMGYLLLQGTFTSAAGDTHTDYYYVEWPQSANLMYTVKNGVYKMEDEAYEDQYEMLGVKTSNIEVYDDNSIIVRAWAGVAGYDLKMYCGTFEEEEEEDPEPWNDGEQSVEKLAVKAVTSIVDGEEKMYTPFEYLDSGVFLTPVETGLEDWPYGAFGSYKQTTLQGSAEVNVNHEAKTGTASILGFFFMSADEELKSESTSLYLVWPADDLPDGISEVITTDTTAPRYNVIGQKVGKSFRGIVVENGKKMLKK